jgi:uncharacterized membrane protein YsdA (DUF1294 family)
LINKKLLLVFSFLIFPGANAQIADTPKNDLKNFFRCGGDLLSEPTRFDSKDWLIFSSVVGVTAASTLIDEGVKSFALKNKGSVGDVIFKVDDLYHIEFMSASIALIYIYGAASRAPDVRNLGLRLTEATVCSGTITLLGKFLLGRERPAKSDDAVSFQPLNTAWEFTSLPSGHATLAFAYSTVMASVYNNFFWKFGWYSLAALVGAARIYNNAHWLSDVLLGGAIGYFVGDFVNKHHINQNKTNSSIPTNPSPDFSVSFGFAF